MATDFHSTTDRFDYYRAASALPTIRFPPASPSEELAQLERRPLPVRWADVWPGLALLLLFASLYIAFYVSKAGWGFAVVVLSVALWPKAGEGRTSERRYKFGPLTLRGDAETDRYFDGLETKRLVAALRDDRLFDEGDVQR